MKWLHSFAANTRGHNTAETPASVITDQLHELRPLPMGMADFMLWSDRIIAGAMVSALVDDQRYVLANEILQLKPTEDHKPDAYFIHLLRKLAANQVADAYRTSYFTEKKARMAAADEAKLKGDVAN